MRRLLALLPAALLLSAAGCGTSGPAAGDGSEAASASQEAAPVPSETAPAPREAALGAPLRLDVGEAVLVGGHTLRFVEVTEDSRCPQGVTCVWEGRARVRLAVDDYSRELTVRYAGMRDGDTAEWSVGGLTVVLDALTPYPGSGDDGAPTEAVVTVREG